MLNRCYVLIMLGMLLCSESSAAIQVRIGINLSSYPELAVVPGYPVYYAPRLAANFFFYDGMYWVFQDDDWYESTWYNGPWRVVEPEFVPVYMLRIPVGYYRQPPMYFRSWHSDAPPRWGDHWGHDWEQRRIGWDKWNRHAVPERAPLPIYQRQYSGEQYPRQMERQHELQKQNYSYQPHDPVVKQHYQKLGVQRYPAQQTGQGVLEEKGPRQQDIQHSLPPSQDDRTTSRSPQKGTKDASRSAPVSPQQERSEDQSSTQQQGANQRDQQTPRSQGREEQQQGKDPIRWPTREQGHEQERSRDSHE